jgi:hypothetical protein
MTPQSGSQVSAMALSRSRSRSLMRSGLTAVEGRGRPQSPAGPAGSPPRWLWPRPLQSHESNRAASSTLSCIAMTGTGRPPAAPGSAVRARARARAKRLPRHPQLRGGVLPGVEQAQPRARAPRLERAVRLRCAPRRWRRWPRERWARARFAPTGLVAIPVCGKCRRGAHLRGLLSVSHASSPTRP